MMLIMYIENILCLIQNMHIMHSIIRSASFSDSFRNHNAILKKCENDKNVKNRMKLCGLMASTEAHTTDYHPRSSQYVCL